MLEPRLDVEALEGTSIVTVGSEDETVLYFIETFPTRRRWTLTEGPARTGPYRRLGERTITD